MVTETTQINHTTHSQTLFMAMELSNTQWRLGFTIGLGQPPRLRKLVAQDLVGLMEEIEWSKKRFGLRVEAAVMSMRVRSLVCVCGLHPCGCNLQP